MNNQRPLLIDISSLIKSADVAAMQSKSLSRLVLERVKSTLREHGAQSAIAFISKQDLDDEKIGFELEIVESVLNGLGVSVVKPQEENLEALIKRCSRDSGAMVLTSNKSLYQLINDDIHMVDHISGDVIDLTEIQNKLGISPHQIPDYLALKGNPATKTPQVVGVGDKLIADLFQKYSALEDILHSEELKSHKILRKLSRFSDKLMSIKSSSLLPDINFNITTINPSRKEPDRDMLLKLYKRYNFNDWILSDGLGGMKVVEDNDSIIGSINALSKEKGILIRPLYKEGKLVSIGISTRSNQVYVYQLEDMAEKAKIDKNMFWSEIKGLLSNPDVGKVIIDAKPFYKTCLEKEIVIKGFKLDPLQAFYNCDTGKNSIKFQYDLQSLNDFVGEHFADVSNKLLSENHLYQLSSSEINMALATESIELFGISVETYRKMQSEFPLVEKYYNQYESKINEILAEMEKEGMYMDGAMLEELKRKTQAGIAKVEGFVQKNAGTSEPVSANLFKTLIYEKYKLIKDEKRSIKREMLESSENRNHPLIAAALEWSKLNQIIININKFAKNIDPETGKVHAVFNHLKTKTGRFSAQEPPVQGFPKKGESIALRNSVKASSGNMIVSIDYSQFELKLLAHLSQDPVLIDSFNKGVDVHKQTASQMYNVPLDRVTDAQRKNAKAINFGLIYGKGTASLALDLGVSKQEAESVLRGYFKQFPKVEEFLNKIKAQVENPQKGYIETLMGRRITLKDANTNIHSAIRQGKNAPMQGSAAELMKMAMVDMYTLISQKFKGARIINQIHDELLFEVPKEMLKQFCIEAKNTMENVVKLSVPLTVDIEVGKSWGLAKPYSHENTKKSDIELNIA